MGPMLPNMGIVETISEKNPVRKWESCSIIFERLEIMLGRSYINNSVKQMSTDQVDTQSQEKDDVVEEEI